MTDNIGRVAFLSSKIFHITMFSACVFDVVGSWNFIFFILFHLPFPYSFLWGSICLIAVSSVYTCVGTID